MVRPDGLSAGGMAGYHSAENKPGIVAGFHQKTPVSQAVRSGFGHTRRRIKGLPVVFEGLFRQTSWYPGRIGPAGEDQQGNLSFFQIS